MKKRAQPGMKQMLLIQIKTANLLSFLLLILDVFHKPTEDHCVFLPLLLCLSRLLIIKMMAMMVVTMTVD